MGAIFFYIFIYFVGYYGSNLFNMFTVRPLITNRYLAALVPVVGVAILHGYMIVTKPPPAAQNITVESALFSYVIMPVIIVTLGAIYFMWNARKEKDEIEEINRRTTEKHEDSDDYDSESEVPAKEADIVIEKQAKRTEHEKSDSIIDEQADAEKKSRDS